MKVGIASSPHLHNKNSTAQMMSWIAIAALPALVLQIYFFSWGSLIQILLCIMTAMLTEALFLKIRQKPVQAYVFDGSAMVTGLLLGLSLPSLAPWWIAVLGSFFAIAIVKQLYGGLGANLFNPAMAGYVMLLVSFPVQMTAWLPVLELQQQPFNFSQAFHWIFSDHSNADIAQLSLTIDGVTAATPLDTVKTQLTLGFTYQEILSHSIFNSWAGKGWLWINMAYLLGGIILLWQGVIRWHIPVALLLSLGACAVLGNIFAPDQSATVLFHWFSGAAMFGAFFIATDPVSASTTVKGRLIYGALIGLLTYIIREQGGYPDGMAFAVLLANLCVPLVDYYTQPRVYGHDTNQPRNEP